jgi:CHAT domain-containing protein
MAAEIRARVLDADTQLLQYTLGEENSYLWVVSAGRLESFRLARREEIERAARRLHAALATPPAAEGTADLEEARRALSALVLESAAAALTGRRLLVVAPGALQYVPLAALPLPDGTPVLARFEVVSAPSASVVATLREETGGRTRAAKGVAVLADPVFEASDPRLAAARRRPMAAEGARLASAAGGGDATRVLDGLRGRGAAGGLGRLPFSRLEAQAIAELAPAGQTFTATGFDASRATATSGRLAGYRVVHFATHGVLSTRRPELSGVVLSLYDRSGRRQDGFLRLHDVYNLKLSADLAVLSGCQTGLGKELAGEGLVGLTRGFLHAGARGVVASLWPVDDESTAELMRRFYRGLLKEGRPPAAALRAAQLEMSSHRRWSAPFHWAGFVVQGEWR